MRTVTAIHKAVSEPIADLVTYRAIPTQRVPMNALDPFIFLNHHGWQQYKPNNNGLPFGPHPHRGFQTVTFILDGDLTHKDSSGASSIIKEGGIQWMIAGRGLIHAEVSSEEFKAKGGPLEILQLWVNLPAKYKMTKPQYFGLQKNEIPTISYDDDKVTAHIISGLWDDIQAPIKPLTDIHLAYITFTKNSQLHFNVPKEDNIFCYVVKGQLLINNKTAQMHDLVMFDHDGENIQIVATEESTLLFGYAIPFNEPFVAYGPFVMNSTDEIKQAYADYHAGKYGNETIFEE